MHRPHHSQFSVALQQPRRQPAPSPSLFAAWRDLWRSAPAELRRDTIRLVLFTPALVAVFAAAWVMLP